MPAPTIRRGFTLSDLAVVLVVLVLLLLLPGLMKQRWNASGVADSLNNVRQILTATSHYRLDNANRVPMRGCVYSNGSITGGWDTWNAFGKNCDMFWSTYSGGVFDESAYSRPLNSYLQSPLAPVPPGYVNTGQGISPTGNPTPGFWTFNHGTPTLAQRAAFELKKCRSPGDLTTRQRTWPNPTPGVSTYNDVGTSYFVNMRWWSQPNLPSNFTLKYSAGTEKIRAMAIKSNLNRAGEKFAWMHDSIADLVSNGVTNVTGEFGGANMSVLGFLSGHAAYTPLVLNAGSGPGYTFLIPWP